MNPIALQPIASILRCNQLVLFLRITVLKKTNNTKDNQHTALVGIITFICVVIVIGFLWSSLKTYTTNRLKDYNSCFWKAAGDNEAVKNRALSSGYSKFDATNAGFDTYAGELQYCDKLRPPEFLIWITNSHS